MCGINGIFAYADAAPPVDEAELLRTREHMVKRGPDGAGLWMSADRRAGLAHRRLAIIDLSPTGAQPMTTADGNLIITFNGEIYNYRALRKELEGRGVRFRSTSDTEVLLHLYAERGAEMVQALRGMYAFAIWDVRRKGLFLARDAYGIKPLYYADDGRTIRLASQVKALLKGGAIDTSPEPAGQVGFFLWGHVPEPYTLYKGIRALEAGTSLWIDSAGRKDCRRFFSITEELAKATGMQLSITREEMRERLHAALLDSVRHHMVADVPVGIFLSAGLDSTTLTALATETGHVDLRTVTLGFREFQGTPEDEVPIAELVGRYYGTHHSTRWVAKDDFQRSRQHLMDVMDQPTTDAVNTYFVSKAAAETGLKVSLSGLGGDELFGGYPSFWQVPRSARVLGGFRSTPWLGKGFRYVSAPILRHLTSPKYASLLEYGGTYGGAYLLRRGMFMPWELPDILDGEVVRQGWQELGTFSQLHQTTHNIDNAHLKVTALESTWYMRNQLLRDADWAGMAHSLEVRLPLVDIELLRLTAPLINSQSAPRKRDMAGVPRKALPTEVITRRKTGFAIPVREWIFGRERWSGQERGLRGWARYLYAATGPGRLRVLALVPDAFGGHGGIALYNRDFLTAVCSHSRIAEVVAFPRNMHNESEELPQKLEYITTAVGGKLQYLSRVLRYVFKKPRFDLIICGHINLLPVAYLLHLVVGARVLLEIYGIDAWNRTRSRLANYLASQSIPVTSISEITEKRFLAWTGRTGEQTFLLPNAIHAERYGVGPKNPSLLARYGLEGKVILMTLGRIVSEERYKGFDEVLQILPTLCESLPTVSYLIVGGGPDLNRLKEKARTLGVSDRVVFTGLIEEQEKADHYRLADVYVMPSHGEGFGFVLLEALACGIPVIASKVDGGREAVRGGALGILVDPDNPAELVAAIHLALQRPRTVPEGLMHFSFDRFQERVHHVIDCVLIDDPKAARQQ